VNRTRRLIKAPNRYWRDTALALFLAGETEPRGPHLENLVLMDLLAWRDVEARHSEVLHWQTATGLEVGCDNNGGSRRQPGADADVERGGLMNTEMEHKRCAWCGNDPLYVAYHDEEWGVPALGVSATTDAFGQRCHLRPLWRLSLVVERWMTRRPSCPRSVLWGENPVARGM